jgi:hypothetical protein
MISNLISELLDKIILEFKKEANQEQLKSNIIDPIIYYIIDKLYPYIFITTVMFVLILLLITSILFLIINGK